ncbi:hypothetical protein ACQUW5_02025 [Legionella sp. CNM-1927-20]|uniref:hypothetical protein n=1 Tax=Legionella sp. CNM-1927-20 TaxID=3422221 RepID=UPI00403AF20A
MPKFNEIGPNEAAKMIVRGVLFGASSDIKDKYRSFVEPFFLSETKLETEEKVPESANRLLDAFVDDLKAIEPINLETSKLSKEEIRMLVAKQVKDVIEIARKYIGIKEFEHYANYLSTIMGNVASRKFVTYNYEDKESVQEFTDSNCNDSQLDYKGRFFHHFEVDKEYAARINAIRAQGNQTKSLEDISIEDGQEMLEDFLESKADISIEDDQEMLEDFLDSGDESSLKF